MPEIRVSASPNPSNYSPAVASGNVPTGNPARSVTPAESSPAHSSQPSTVSPPAAGGGNTNTSVGPGVAALIESRPDVALAQFRATQLRNQSAGNGENTTDDRPQLPSTGAGNQAVGIVAPVSATEVQDSVAACRARSGSDERRATAISPSTAQALIDREYRSLGLDFGRSPLYDPGVTAHGTTDDLGRVRIGASAISGGPGTLRSTLIHEAVHIEQQRNGRWATHGRDNLGSTAGNVNELEAYRAELLSANLARSGVSKLEEVRAALKYEEHLGNLERQGSVGDYYLRRVLIYEDFGLRPQDVLRTSVPGASP